jgi:dihydroorotate dehydrogenase electron transfer subunit
MDRFAISKRMFSSKVRKVSKENYRVTTIEVEHALEEAMPGQFLMVWMPGLGEKPMSIGNRYPLTISVADVGAVSGAIGKLKAGDLLSYRGPLGKPFIIPRGTKRILVIGGGYGVVPMYFLARNAKEGGVEAMAVIGGRSGKEIIYEKQLFAVCSEVFITTDDGTRGKRGTVMAEAQALIEGRGFDCVYCCGPERMMHAVAMLCKQHKVHCQVSIERHMKCGVGVCGSCDVNGKLCCSDGPVFSGEEALALTEFGKKRRDACGVLSD